MCKCHDGNLCPGELRRVAAEAMIALFNEWTSQYISNEEALDMLLTRLGITRQEFAEITGTAHNA